MKSKIYLLIIIFLASFGIICQVQAADLDLTIEEVTFMPAQPLVDQTVKIIVKAKYIGSAPLTTNLGVNNVAFSHKDFQSITSAENGSSVTPSAYSPLYSGTYFTYTFVGKFTSTGEKSLVLKIDGANKLAESSETNNTIKPKVNVLKSGDLVKLASDSAVYVIKADNKKHLYVNGPTFWSYFTGTWSSLKLDGWPIYIQEISQAAFDSLPIGSNITVKSGSRLIKFSNSPKIYTVFGAAKLKYLTEEEAVDLYGAKWAEKVVIIQNGFEANYTYSDQGFIDTDGDGLANEDETNIYHTNPAKTDTDGDTYNDGLEIMDGFNPNGLGKL